VAGSAVSSIRRQRLKRRIGGVKTRFGRDGPGDAGGI
jgi:hypothetical protein